MARTALGELVIFVIGNFLAVGVLMLIGSGSRKLVGTFRKQSEKSEDEAAASESLVRASRLIAQGQTMEAARAFAQIVAFYPGTDAARIASSYLKDQPKPSGNQ